MKGLDAVIFAGRYSSSLGQIIYALAKDMAFLGVSLNEMPWKTDEELTCITSKDSQKQIYMNSLDEKQIIARQTRKNLTP
jgi:acetate kinase